MGNDPVQDLSGRFGSLDVPPLRGSTRAIWRAEGGEPFNESCVESPSLSLPLKGGGESEPQLCSSATESCETPASGAFTSPLEGEVTMHRREGDASWEGGERQIPSLRLTPLPSLPPQGGRGEQAARPHAKLTLREAFAAAAGRLREAGVETPELDARLLLCHAAGLAHEGFIARAGDALKPEAQACLEAVIARRLAGEPVSRITGVREFYGREFLLGPHTLDPRPDTETLIEAVLDLAAQNGWHDQPIDVLDLGTGTGCILVTLLAELPQALGIGTDIDAGALAVATENARRHGVTNRVSFVAADWLHGIGGQFDLVVSNPPYLAASEMATLPAEVAHDPRHALDGGGDGLDAYRRIAAGAADRLRDGGRILLEIGASQAESVAHILSEPGFALAEPRLLNDLAGRPRCLAAGRAQPERADGRGVQNLAWKIAMFRLGSGQRPTFDGHRRSQGRGRLQRQQERTSREPRLTGSRLSGRSGDAQPPTH